jgi:hypothetical protein
VYWEVDDIEAAHRRCLDAGAAPRSDIMTTALKSKAATVIDPFGNVIGLTSKRGAASGKPLTARPSDSAMGVAFFRALATRDEREEIRGPASLAEKFLPQEYQAMLDAHGFLRRRRVPGASGESAAGCFPGGGIR